MKSLIPYLFFNGNCREAMQFYQQCFNGKLEVLTYKDAPAESKQLGTNDEIMHACLTVGDLTLMASDWPNKGAEMGNNIQLNISCSNLKEIEKLFSILSEKGTVIQPLADTFWGARFGMLVDRFGIHWMLNCMLQK